MSGFWFRPDGDALYADAFGSMDSQSKRQELLIEFLEVLKLINEVVRYFRHCCSCLSVFLKKPSRRARCLQEVTKCQSCYCFLVNPQQNSCVKLNVADGG
jgi:hypothetical protein